MLKRILAALVITVFSIAFLVYIKKNWSQERYTLQLVSSKYALYGGDGAQMFQLGDSVYRTGLWNPLNTPVVDSQVWSAHISDLSAWRQTGLTPFKARHTIGYGQIGDTAFLWGRDVYSNDSEGHNIWAAYADASGRLTWSLVNEWLPYSSRVLFGACVHQGALYTLGGQNRKTDSAALFDDIWKSVNGGRTWTKIADGLSFLGKNLSGCVVSYNGYIYVIGGGVYDPNQQHFTSTVYRIRDNNDGTISWEQMKNAPFPGIQYTSCVVFDGKLFKLFGGEYLRRQGSRRIYYMDSAQNWYKVPFWDIPERHAATVITIKGPDNKEKMLIANGTDATGSRFLNDLYTVTVNDKK